MPIATPEHAASRGAIGAGPQPDGQISGLEKQDLLQHTLADLRRMLYFRRQYDQRRSMFYRQYLSQRDAKMFPDNITPRSNTFIPYAHSNIETLVSRVLDAFFSQDPAFETRGNTPQDEAAADQMQQNLIYGLHRAQLIPHFESLVRNIGIYGHSGIKVDWDWGSEIVYGKEPQFHMVPVVDPQTGQPQTDPQTGQIAMQPATGPTGEPIITGYKPVQHTVPRACPKFTAIDVYDLLVDPDGKVKAHLTEKTLRQLQHDQQMYQQQNQQDLYFPEALATLASRLASEPNSQEVLIRIAEVWDENTNTWTITTFGEDKEALSWKDQRAALRGASYSAYKRKIYAGEPLLLWTGPNPFMHKRCPILDTSMIKLPNEVFGLGAIEIISDLNESLNRFVNMISDNWNTGINRRYAYDTNADIDHEALNNFNTPGGKVGVTGDPSKVIFPLPTHTPEPGDYMIMDVYKQMIEMTGGISDFYAKGVGAPTGNRTATGISQVIGESNYRFKMFIRNLEVDIFQPMLEMCASMIMQFLPDQIMQMVSKAPFAIPPVFPRSPEDLYGNFTWDIVAANYITNKVVRQRNLMALANVLGQTPYLDMYEGARELIKAFEIRNPKLLKTPQQVQQEQQAAKQEEISMMIFQSMLDTESKARLSQAKPQPGSAPNRRPHQPEGKIPGAGLTSAIRGFAQAHGANAFGLHDMGEGGLGV